MGLYSSPITEEIEGYLPLETDFLINSVDYVKGNILICISRNTLGGGLGVEIHNEMFQHLLLINTWHGIRYINHLCC